MGYELDHWKSTQAKQTTWSSCFAIGEKKILYSSSISLNIYHSKYNLYRYVKKVVVLFKKNAIDVIVIVNQFEQTPSFGLCRTSPYGRGELI